MSNDVELVRTLTDKAFIGGDVGVIVDLVSLEYVDHDPMPGFGADRAGFQAVAADVTGALSDRRLEFDDLIETADGRVVESWAMVARHDGELFGLPASGQEVRVRGVEIWRCEDGMIVEHWGAIDASDVADKAMAALG
jgi:predicted ester cyclase